jgi:lipopolysaccharide transport system ATP-binding protein
MAAPIISVRNLSKCYRVGGMQSQDTLRDHMAHAAKSLRNVFSGQTNGANASKSPSEVWVLNDVSFDVRPGEVVGVVGRNGAGKSTLLKLLSQITEPTRGEARIKGRIASLLEVGTGFHPELTGRENIYLNGAILGMTKAEINRKFDDIVAFSEVEKFIDTPVKRYSSGMYMRLAFGVAANLQPEIMIVDEVLAVGDVQFQKKCLGKMADVSRSGRTILFVSHNLAAVQKLCTRAILLEQGVLKFDGGTEECIARYLHGAKEEHGEFTGYHVSQELIQRQPADAPIRITGVEMFDLEQRPLEQLNVNGGFTLRTHYVCNGQFPAGAVSLLLHFKTHLGLEMIRLNTMPIGGYHVEKLGRAGYFDLTIHSLPLVGGRYTIDFKFFQLNVENLVHLPDLVAFDVTPTDVYGSGVAMAQDRGLIAVPHRWNQQICENKQALQPSAV